MPERRPLRAIHTSDVHLGAYPLGEPGVSDRRARMDAGFTAVVDLALREDADVLLIAGDFFDNDRSDDAVDFAIGEIRRFGRPTVIVPGNHDPMDDGMLYWRYDFEGLAPNLRIIRSPAGEAVEVDGVDLVVWGRAYRVADHFNFRPLEDLPSRLDKRWHVAMAHGHYFAEGRHVDRSMPIHESELIAAAGQWDYMAFGHFEVHRDVSAGGTTAIYSGAPVPFSDVTPHTGWALVVDFEDDGVQWRKHSVDPRRVE